MSYSDTVFLPETTFSMKASLTTAEPRILKKWKENGTYQKMLARAQQSGKPAFTIADGPPYANGSIHVGHVLNKILKDIAVKYWNMNGRPSKFTPGWDCHGLPIELKTLSKKPDNLREACHQEALKWVEHQKSQFMRLGILADWDNPYLTLSPEYQAAELETLAQILKEGRLYRGLKPVYWCFKLGTALAAAEVEYAEMQSPSLHVKYMFEDQHVDPAVRHQYLIVWTTSPWTLPAGEAVCINPNFYYSRYRIERKNTEGDYLPTQYWVMATDSAPELLEQWVAKNLIASYQEEESYLGSELEGKLLHHPVRPKQVPIISGDHVDKAGTGCVHTAPGHGLDDYKVGLKYKLPVICVIGPYGKMDTRTVLPDMPELHNASMAAANKLICDRLARFDNLVADEAWITHQFPHNPRTGTPVYFRATPQWFVRYDEQLRATANDVLDRIDFVPEAGRNRLSASIHNSPDWCLSRQRTWGVPIPALLCECGRAEISPELVELLADATRRAERSAADVWPTLATTFHVTCSGCCKELTKIEPVILDVWFDSGAYHAAVGQADVYLEGSDQHRGWFQTSLMSALAAGKPAPFAKVVTHGFVVDEQGRKMAKSVGNVVEPETVINQYGAEILRLWVMSEDFTKDVGLGPKHFDRFADSYRKFRNTFRFLMGGLADFKPEMLIPAAGLSALDRWMLHHLNTLIREAHESYQGFRFHELFHNLMSFFVSDLSSFYFDIIKGCLYTYGRDWPSRRSVQTVMWHMVDVLHRLMAPCLSFLAEEVSETMGWESPFVREFPMAVEAWDDGSLNSLVREAIVIRDQVYKQLDTLRVEHQIGASLEARVELTVDPKFKDLWIAWDQFLIVSRVDVLYGDVTEIKVLRCDAPKCERCWVRTYSRTGDVCNRCHSVLKETPVVNT